MDIKNCYGHKQNTHMGKGDQMLIILDRVCTDEVQGGNQITLKACDYQHPPTSLRSHMI